MQSKSGRGAAGWGMALLLAALLAGALVGCGSQEQPPASEPEALSSSPAQPEESPEDASPADDAPLYPPGKLIAEQAREDYQDGELWLYIPRLEGKWPVLDGVDDDTLAGGIGLFDQAQLPRGLKVNSNTSIAGHRDIGGMEFYSIDQIEEGDLIYLSYQGTLYTYEVWEQLVTHDADWDPIRTRDFPCVTLQSCEPIGVASHRIFIVGKLIEAAENTNFPE